MSPVPAIPERRPLPRWKRVGCFGLLCLLCFLIALPYVGLWKLMVAVADRAPAPAAYSPSALPSYSPPPSPAPPSRHPPVDRDPGPGYVWVHPHQQGSKWVEGYWRRRPGYWPPVPAADTPAQ